VGSRPFAGGKLEAMWATVEGEVPSPSSVVANYPPFLEQIVMRCLAREPHARFEDAVAAAAALEAAVHQAGWMPSRQRLGAYLRAHGGALFGASS
jgi:hypothetical protein